MTIRYTDEAMQDFRDAIDYGRRHDLAEPVEFVRKIRQRLARLVDIRAPGRRGRVEGTFEWVLEDVRRTVIFKRWGGRVEVLRVLPGASIESSPNAPGRLPDREEE